MKVRKLSESTINRIAAGEVIERPASVIKELVENSIDAGATKIEITLEQAGKNLIVVTDNGSGIAYDDLLLVVERHTTSKLNEQNLMDIKSFGFRGEALPSIASISKFKIVSRIADSDHAYELVMNGGEGKNISTAIHNIGTKIEVRDLFFATPARIKFLKSEKMELLACTNIIKKIAIAYPQIFFKLHHGNKELLKYRSISDNENSRSRIYDILKSKCPDNYIEISATQGNTSLSGIISLPTFSHRTKEHQYLFVNNRPVKDKLLSIAIKIAYQDVLAKDQNPVVVLFIQIDPEEVDVNVHPTKNEVRFRDSYVLRKMVTSAIQEGIYRSGNRTAHVDINTYCTIPQVDINRRNIQDLETKWHTPQLSNDCFRQQVINLKSPPQSKAAQNYDYQYSRIECENNRLGAACMQIHKTYIISQTQDSVIITDQHAAHERIVYEGLKKQVASSGIIKQKLLLPEVIVIDDEQRVALLEYYRPQLADMSLVIEKHTDCSFIIREVPSLLNNIDVHKLLNDIADSLVKMEEDITVSKLIEHILETFACHHSIRSGRELNLNEMNELLRQMEVTPLSGQCNHGRPTYVEFKLKDIEKLFGR